MWDDDLDEDEPTAPRQLPKTIALAFGNDKTLQRLKELRERQASQSKGMPPVLLALSPPQPWWQRVKVWILAWLRTEGGP